LESTRALGKADTEAGIAKPVVIEAAMFSILSLFFDTKSEFVQLRK